MSSDEAGRGTIAVSLGPDPIPAAGPVRVRRAATLAGALRSGRRVLDLSDTPGPAGAWTFARDAAGEFWRELTVVVPDPPPEGSTAPAPARVVVVRSSVPARGDGSSSPGDVGVRYGDLGAAEVGSPGALAAGARWISVPGSVLAASRLIPLASAIRGAGAEILLSNPHADGRLDGLWMNDGLGADSRRPRPLDIHELERAYAPVLALRFLTESRHRTLPQAAVAFAWAIGATPSVRFRDLGQVDSFGNPAKIVPLTASEVARLSGGDLPRLVG
jgi:hypothetical protein